MLNIEEIKAREHAATPGPWEARLNLAWNKKLNIEPNVAFTQEEVDADFIAHARTDIPALIEEAERLTDQHQCDAHNLAAMRATLDQQAENCEKLLESYKESNLEQATENYELEQENAKLKESALDPLEMAKVAIALKENAKLKSEVERLTAGNAALQSEKNKLVTQNRRIINREMGRDQQIATLTKQAKTWKAIAIAQKDENTTLIAEVERLTEENQHLHDCDEENVYEIIKCKKQIATLKKALELAEQVRTSNPEAVKKLSELHIQQAQQLTHETHGESEAEK